MNYTIEDLDSKVKDLQQRLIKISYKFTELLEQGLKPEKEEIAEQKAVKKEYEILLKIYKDMKTLQKTNMGVEKNDLASMLLNLGKLASGHNIGDIQQKIM